MKRFSIDEQIDTNDEKNPKPSHTVNYEMDLCDYKPDDFHLRTYETQIRDGLEKAMDSIERRIDMQLAKDIKVKEFKLKIKIEYCDKI